MLLPRVYRYVHHCAPFFFNEVLLVLLSCEKHTIHFQMHTLYFHTTSSVPPPRCEGPRFRSMVSGVTRVFTILPLMMVVVVGWTPRAVLIDTQGGELLL